MAFPSGKQALAKAAGGSVFLTDYSDEVLQRCMRNVGENDLDDGPGCRGRDHGEAEPGGGGCRVRKLDWADPRFPGRDEANRLTRFEIACWTDLPLTNVAIDLGGLRRTWRSCPPASSSLRATSLTLTASQRVLSRFRNGSSAKPHVYILPCPPPRNYSRNKGHLWRRPMDNGIMEEPIVSISNLQSPAGRQMVLAVERRVCFTAPELTETSREHDFLLSLLGVQGREGKTSEGLNSGERRLLCERLRVDFEQRVAYDRHPNLQLWRVWLDDGATVHPPTWMSKLSPM